MIPVLFEEKRIFFSSAEKDAPEIAVAARNCSMVYCREGRPGGPARSGAAAKERGRRMPRKENRRRSFMGNLLDSVDSIARVSGSAGGEGEGSSRGPR